LLSKQGQVITLVTHGGEVGTPTNQGVPNGGVLSVSPQTGADVIVSNALAAFFGVQSGPVSGNLVYDKERSLFSALIAPPMTSLYHPLGPVNRPQNPRGYSSRPGLRRRRSPAPRPSTGQPPWKPSVALWIDGWASLEMAGGLEGRLHTVGVRLWCSDAERTGSPK
jgi:hypothetical protein